MDGFPAQAGPGIRFGMTELFSMSTRQMTITNCGDEDLIITKIETGMIFPPAASLASSARNTPLCRPCP